LPPLRALHLGRGTSIQKQRKYLVSKDLEYLAIDFTSDPESCLHFLQRRPRIRTLVVTPDFSESSISLFGKFVKSVPDLEKLHCDTEPNQCEQNTDVRASSSSLVLGYLICPLGCSPLQSPPSSGSINAP
jgi:hypothetical protein